MGTLSAEQWGFQAWLLLSKSSSRARWGAGILQSNRRLLLEPAGAVMQLAEKGGQPVRCAPWPVSPAHAAWQQQAEWPRRRDFKTLSGREVAGGALDVLGLKNLAFALSLFSACAFWSLLCDGSSRWRKGQLQDETPQASRLHTSPINSTCVHRTCCWWVSDLRASHQKFSKLTKYLCNEIPFKLNNTLKFPESVYWQCWQ